MSAQVTVGVMGGAQRGKSTLASGLMRAAGVPEAVRIVETSDHIYALTLAVISWILAHGSRKSRGDLTRRLLRILPELFNSSGCNQFGIPDRAFRAVRRLNESDPRYGKLAEAARDVRLRPAVYSQPITIDNKNEFRPLMSALQHLASEVLAIPWLRRNGYPEATSLWAEIAWAEIDELARQYPAVPMLVCSGLRMPGDERGLRDRTGYLLARRRPVSTECDHLSTEKEHLACDYVIDGDCALSDLPRFLGWLWHQMCGPNALTPGLAEATVISIPEVLARL